MRGIGECLSAPLDLPRLPAVLVNPGVAVPTKDVFAALACSRAHHARAARTRPATRVALLVGDCERSKRSGTAGDRAAARDRRRARRTRELPGCRLARMSGSGATCFGLFESNAAATAAARTVRGRHPQWWVRATVLGAAQSSA